MRICSNSNSTYELETNLQIVYWYRILSSIISNLYYILYTHCAIANVCVNEWKHKCAKSGKLSGGFFVQFHKILPQSRIQWLKGKDARIQSICLHADWSNAVSQRVETLWAHVIDKRTTEADCLVFDRFISISRFAADVRCTLFIIIIFWMPDRQSTMSIRSITGNTVCGAVGVNSFIFYSYSIVLWRILRRLWWLILCILCIAQIVFISICSRRLMIASIIIMCTHTVDRSISVSLFVL